jgi:hypothetical protein
MSAPTLCENGLDAPKGCSGKSKPAQAGRVLQKVSALLIQVFLLVVKILVRKEADYACRRKSTKLARSSGQT